MTTKVEWPQAFGSIENAKLRGNALYFDIRSKNGKFAVPAVAYGQKVDAVKELMRDGGAIWAKGPRIDTTMNDGGAKMTVERIKVVYLSNGQKKAAPVAETGAEGETAGVAEETANSSVDVTTDDEIPF